MNFDNRIHSKTTATIKMKKVYITHKFLHAFLKKFIYFCLHWVFVAVRGLSLVAASGAYSFIVVCGLLIAVASLVVEHRL